MPRTAFTTGAHRDDSQVDRFEQVRLDSGEHARLWVPNEDWAWMELVHNIRAPIFEEGTGKPVKTTKRNKEVFETDGISRPICLGDPDAVKADELDPGTCPACAEVKAMLAAGLADARDLRPQWRYALPVISYDLANRKLAEGKLRNPPNGRVLVWPMSPWIYRKLDDTRAQTADLLMVKGGKEAVKLQMSDIMVHCENGQFLTYDRMWPLRAAHMHDSDAGRRVKAVLEELWADKENRPTEEQLRAACGREPDKDWMRRDMEDAHYRWDKAVNGSSQVGSGASSGGRSLAEATDALLADGPPDDDDPLAAHPGGTAEFASPERKAELAAGGGSLFDDAPPAPAPAPASAPADDSPFGGVTTAAPAAAPASAPVDSGLFGDAVPSPPNGSGERRTQSFTQLIDEAGAG